MGEYLYENPIFIAILYGIIRTIPLMVNCTSYQH